MFHNYFGPFNEGFLYAPAGDIEALEELVDRTTCAVMLELIQGEGGVMALDPDYVQAVRKLCDEKDLVLIVDEVQTGVGRTGTFLCCEHYNLKPDVVTLAKGLGGGLPIGAVLMNEKVAEGMGPGTHGSTFGGNPVVCAGANVVVDRMDPVSYTHLDVYKRQELYMTVNAAGDQMMLVSLFDNLGKGSSGAAVQCMNLMLGLEETEGLE